MFERFTDRARNVMALANEEAQRRQHAYIGPEHILFALVKEGSGVGAYVLKNLGVELDHVNREIDKLLAPGSDPVTAGKLQLTPRAKKIIEYGRQENRLLNHNYVGTEHLLLGLLRETDSLPAQIFMNLGLTVDQVRAEVLTALAADSGSNDPATSAETHPFDEWFALTYPGAPTESRHAALIAWNAAIHAADEQLSRITNQMLREAKYEQAAVVRDAKEIVKLIVRIA